MSSTCIDLILTDQPNLIVNSGVHPSHPLPSSYNVLQVKP